MRTETKVRLPMKRIPLILLSFALICLFGCQDAQITNQNTEAGSIPVMYCDFESESIFFGEWDLQSNDLIVSKNNPIGMTDDPYTLYSLRWDGDKTIAGLQVYLETINHFEDGVILNSRDYGEFIKGEVSISVSDNGKLILNTHDTTYDISDTNIFIDGLGQVTPSMMNGNALVVHGENIYYLQSVMVEDGIYFVCSVISMPSMTVENYMINSVPYSYEEVDVETFGEDTFAVKDSMVYFYTKQAVYSFDPEARTVTEFLTLDDLKLSTDKSDVRFQISGVSVYEENIIVECAEYITDIPSSRTSYLCSSAGEVIQSLKWNCSTELVVFPKE